MLDFLGIGAQKAGTSWLHANLIKHPHLCLPDVKELHFWDSRRHLGIDWYKGLFEAVPPGSRGGEITPAYAILDAATIDEIRRHFPDLRLLYCIRNPIERAWSSALMALWKAEMRPEEASDQWFLDHFRSAGSLRRGDYEACLRAWLRAFPAERLLLVRFEDIQANPSGVLTHCAHHLGVDPAPFQLLPAAELARPVNANRPVPLRPSLRPALEEIYLPKIEALERFLGLDLSHWRRPASSASG